MTSCRCRVRASWWATRPWPPSATPCARSWAPRSAPCENHGGSAAGPRRDVRPVPELASDPATQRAVLDATVIQWQNQRTGGALGSIDTDGWQDRGLHDDAGPRAEPGHGGPAGRQIAAAGLKLALILGAQAALEDREHGIGRGVVVDARRSVVLPTMPASPWTVATAVSARPLAAGGRVLRSARRRQRRDKECPHIGIVGGGGGAEQGMKAVANRSARPRRIRRRPAAREVSPLPCAGCGVVPLSPAHRVMHRAGQLLAGPLGHRRGRGARTWEVAVGGGRRAPTAFASRRIEMAEGPASRAASTPAMTRASCRSPWW